MPTCLFKIGWGPKFIFLLNGVPREGENKE